jgi:aryl-alcohol dehydrogenase-like predicted oxidoreductase
MDYRHLGRTGLRVSPLCLGTMNFGPHTTEPDSHAILDAGLDAGLNFVDTANVYGSGGGTETILGTWLAQGGGRREKTVLATKVYGDMGEWPNSSKLSALNIRRACDASLQRLQTDYIDLYQMHHIDRATPWDEIWEAMETLRAQGKILYVGSSNFAGWHIAKANEAAARRHILGLVSEQCLYNLNARQVELEVLPACRDYGVGVIPWSPLASGLLGGRVSADAGGRRAGGWMPGVFDANRDKVEAFEKSCADWGERPADIALAWLLSRPGVTAPIIGPRTLEQLTQALRATEITLDEAQSATLDEIFPGPGGEAPEAFAW